MFINKERIVKHAAIYLGVPLTGGTKLWRWNYLGSSSEMGSPRGLFAAFSGVKRSAWWKSDAAILGSLAPMVVDSNKQHMGYSTYSTIVGWDDIWKLNFKATVWNHTAESLAHLFSGRHWGWSFGSTEVMTLWLQTSLPLASQAHSLTNAGDLDSLDVWKRPSFACCFLGGMRFKKLRPHRTLDQCLEIIIWRQMLKVFFLAWQSLGIRTIAIWPGRPCAGPRSCFFERMVEWLGKKYCFKEANIKSSWQNTIHQNQFQLCRKPLFW